MRRVTSQVRLAHRVRIANVWLLEDAGKRFVVDTSHFVERWSLRASLWEAGIRGRGDLDGVIITHRHSDHAGNARWLRDTYGAPVFAHRDDAPILAGHVRPPPLFRSTSRLHERLLTRIEDILPARCPVDDVWESGTWQFGFRAIPVPGHTEGSSMLHHEPSGTLFSGDAILAGLAPLRAFEVIRLAVDGFSLDVARCHDETRRFLRDIPRTDTLCSGHGPAVREDVADKLKKLADR